MSTRKRTIIVFPVLLTFLILAVILGGIWSGYSERTDSTAGQSDPEEFLVNDDFSAADQGYSDIGVDGIGNFWIVWQDNREGDYSTYAQHFAWDGERYGPNSPVNDDTGGDEQNDPHVGVSAAGYVKFVWQDFRVTGYPDNPDIYGQDINEDGSVNGPNHRVNADFGQAKQRKPNLDVSPTGAAVVVWEDYRLNNWDIYAQWYAGGGAAGGGNVKVNDDVDAIQHRPFTAADGLGNVLICWYDNRSGDDEVFGQIYNASRSAVGGNFRINEVGAASKQKFPAAAGLPGGGFVVVWTDYRNGPYPADPDVYGQLISPTGAPIGGNFRANDDGGGIEQTEPQVGSAPTGGFVICWRDERNGAADIYAQRYEPTGDAAGGNFRVNAQDAGVLQSSPAVAMSDAKMYFTWTDNRNSGLFDIYGSIITYDNPTISPIPSFVFFEAEDGGPNPLPQQMLITNSGAGVLEWAAVDDAAWLALSHNFGTAPTAVDLLVNITGLPIGDYTATITFTDINDPGITGMATVNLRVDYGAPIIDVSPTALEFEGGLIGAPPPPQQIEITNIGGKTLNWQTSVTEDWLSVLPPTGTAPSSPLVYVDPHGLAVGTHEGTLSILDPTSYNLQVNVVVSLEVIDNAPEIELSESALYFAAFEKQGNPPPQQVQIANIGYGTLAFVVESGPSGLLDASPLSGFAPDDVDIWAFTDTLVPGDYYDTLLFVDTLAKNSPFRLPVHIEVDALPPEIGLSQTEFSFSGVRAVSDPPPEEFQIDNTGGGQMHWSIEYNSAWLACAPDTGTGPQTIQCRPDISVSGSGEFADTILVSDPVALNSPQTIAVSLLVDEPDTLSIPALTAQPGEEIVVPLALINADSITDISLPVQYDPDYLHLDSAVFTGGRIVGWMFRSVFTDPVAGTVKFFATSHAVPIPDEPLSPGRGPVGFLHFTVSPATPAGTMMDIDTVTLDLAPLSLANTAGTAFVPHVIPGGVSVGVPPEISLAPAGLTFTADRSGTAPPTQQVTINNTDGGTLAWTATADADWLTINPESGGNGQIIICTVNQSGLTAGEFSGQVMVTDPAATNSPQTVSIQLVLDEPDTLLLPVVSASPGDDLVIPVMIDNSDAIKEIRVPLVVDPTYVELDSASFTGARIAGWPTLSATVDSKGGTVILTGNSTSTPLTPGSGAIGLIYAHLTAGAPGGVISTIDTGTVGGSGLLMISSDDVSFVPGVLPGRIQGASAPQISLAPKALDFSAVRGGPAPSTQQFIVGNTGEGSLDWTAGTTGGWLAVDPLTGGVDQQVTCTVNHGGWPSGEYTGTVTISDPAAGNSPQSVAVHLTLDEPDTLHLPVVDAIPTADMTIPIAIKNSDWIKELRIPLKVNPTYIRLDSASFTGARIAGWPTLTAIVDSPNGTVVLSGSSTATPLAPGEGTVGVVHAHVSTGAPGGLISTIDTITVGGSGLSAVSSADVSFIPRVVAGRVQAAFSPQISLTPTRLYFRAVRGGDAPFGRQFTINNTGGGNLSWTAGSATSWLSIDPVNGGDGQSVTCRVDNSGLLTGVHVGSAIISDPGAGNSPQQITIVFSIDEPDTLLVPDLDAEPAQEVVVPVHLRNSDWIAGLQVPLYFNPSYVFLDSASFIGSRIVGWPAKSAVVNPQGGTAIFSGSSSATPLPPGSGIIGHVFLHVHPEISGAVMIQMDSITVGQTSLALTDTNGVIITPRVVPGYLQIAGTTGIVDEPRPGQDELPALVNYPNPFNAETMIFIRGTVDPWARLVVYDVLGRLVRDLSNDLETTAGSSYAVWDGSDESGRPLGTGMYFATLRTARHYTTQKILLLR